MLGYLWTAEPGGSSLRDGVEGCGAGYPSWPTRGPCQVFVGVRPHPGEGGRGQAKRITEHLSSASEQQILIQEAAQRS